MNFSEYVKYGFKNWPFKMVAVLIIAAFVGMMIVQIGG